MFRGNQALLRRLAYFIILQSFYFHYQWMTPFTYICSCYDALGDCKVPAKVKTGCGFIEDN